jgi:hypothetical protein
MLLRMITFASLWCKSRFFSRVGSSAFEFHVGELKFWMKVLAKGQLNRRRSIRLRKFGWRGGEYIQQTRDRSVVKVKVKVRGGNVESSTKTTQSTHFSADSLKSRDSTKVMKIHSASTNESSAFD